MDVARLFQLALPISIAATVFAFGLGVRGEDGWRLLERRGLALRSLLSLTLVMPALAVLLSATFQLDTSLEIALLALSVSPVSPIVPWSVRKAGGHDAYAVAVLFGSALLAVLFVPASVQVIGGLFHADVSAPAAMVVKAVLVTVLAPLVLAVLVIGLIGPERAQRLSVHVVKAAAVLLGIAFLPIAVHSLRPMLELVGNWTLLAILVQVAGGLIAGHWLGGPNDADRTVLALSTASRHPAVALTIGTAAASADAHLAPAILLYLLISSVGGSLYVRWQHGRRHPTAAAPLAPA